MTPEQRAIWLAGRTKHGGYAGGAESSEHAIWRGILSRCTNPNNKNYPQYGGAGIHVSPEWVGDGGFVRFMLHIGSRPSRQHQVDRIDNLKGYVPGNVRWATRSEQQKNKSSTRTYSNGVFTGTLVEVAAHLGISKALLHWRWKNWNTFEKEVSWHELQKAL